MRESRYPKCGRCLQTQDHPTFEPETQLDIWKGVPASVANGMTTSRPRGVPRRRELGLRIAQSSVTAQSQLEGALRPRQDRSQVSPGLPRDLQETHRQQGSGKGGQARRSHPQLRGSARELGPPSRDPTAGGSRKAHVCCISPWEQSPLRLGPRSLMLPRKLQLHFQTQVKTSSYCKTKAR